MVTLAGEEGWPFGRFEPFERFGEWWAESARAVGSALLLPSMWGAIGLGVSLPWDAQGQVEVQPPRPSGQPASSGAEVERQQFVMKVEDAALRGVVAGLAGQVKGDFESLYALDGDAWRYPIEIHVRASEAMEGEDLQPRTVIDYLPSGDFRLMLGVELPERFSRESLDREILRMLLLEKMLIGADGDSLAGKRVVIPDWILTGTRELLAHRESGRRSDRYRSLVGARQLLPLSEILGGPPKAQDSITQTIYSASSGALISALLSLDGGSSSFFSFLRSGLEATEPGGSETVEARLRERFPALREGEGSLSKWWALELAELGEANAVEYLSRRETEQALDDALQVGFAPVETAPEKVAPAKRKGILSWFRRAPEPESDFVSGTVHDFELFLERESAPRVLDGVQVRLRALFLRCAPLYRPVVRGYEQAVERMRRGETRGLADELEQADRMRQAVGEIMARTEDVLNHYQAARAPESSGEEFEAYTRAVRELESRPRPARSDPVSRYLDQLEKEFDQP